MNNLTASAFEWLKNLHEYREELRLSSGTPSKQIYYTLIDMKGADGREVPKEITELVGKGYLKQIGEYLYQTTDKEI